MLKQSRYKIERKKEKKKPLILTLFLQIPGLSGSYSLLVLNSPSVGGEVLGHLLGSQLGTLCYFLQNVFLLG